MKRGSLFCAGWWSALILLIGPLILLIPLLAYEWRAIEQDVAQNANTQLQEAGIIWATVETFNRGRDALITGTPPSAEAIDKAKEIVKQAEGVYKKHVTISGDVIVPPAPPTPPTLNTLVTGESVVVRGTLGNQRDVDRVLAQAASVFGADNVLNKLSIGENIGELPPLGGLFKGVAGKALGLNTLTASLQDGKLRLQGDVPSEEIRQSAARELGLNFSGEIVNDLTVVVPIKRDDCQDLVNDLLKTGRINFASSKADISPESIPLLDQIVQTARRCPGALFEVAGHTDSVGEPEFNKKLSEDRARAVVQYLVDQGLDASRFTPAGYGPEQPIGDNNTTAGRAQNRRIEFRLQTEENTPENNL